MREGNSETNGTNGVHPEGMRAHSIPFAEIEDPIDLVAVQADDELINALASGMSVSAPGVDGYDADDHVAAILAAWRAEVDAEPIPELVDVDTAVATIVAGRPPSRRARHLAPVAAAAAFIVLAVGGLTVGSYSSEPGDALWAVSKVLYSERAESKEAAARVETHIDKAKHALVMGEPVVAEQELQQAVPDLAVVRPEEGKVELAEVQDFLVAKALETPPGTPTDPGAPLATDRTRRVPAGAALEGARTQDRSPASTSSDSSVTGAPGGTTDPNTGPALTGVPDPSATPSTDPDASLDGGPTGSTGPTATSEGSADPTDPTIPPGQSMGETSGGTSGAGGTAAGGTTAAGSGAS